MQDKVAMVRDRVVRLPDSIDREVAAFMEMCIRDSVRAKQTNGFL